MKANLQSFFSGFLLLLAMALLLHTYSDEYEGMGIGAQFGPMFYPRILLWMWAGLSGLLVVTSVLGKVGPPAAQRWGRLALMFGLVSGSTFLLTQIGFLFSMLLFALSSSWFMGYRKPLGLALAGVVFPISTWYLFHEILLIRLPVSPWFTWV
jgi:hypothetical protein